MLAKDELARLQRKLDDGTMDPEEPLFTLRGQDKLAPIAVKVWVELLDFAYGGSGSDKGTEALEVADEMEAWSPRKIPD